VYETRLFAVCARPADVWKHSWSERFYDLVALLEQSPCLVCTCSSSRRAGPIVMVDPSGIFCERHADHVVRVRQRKRVWSPSFAVPSARGLGPHGSVTRLSKHLLRHATRACTSRSRSLARTRTARTCKPHESTTPPRSRQQPARSRADLRAARDRSSPFAQIDPPTARRARGARARARPRPALGRRDERPVDGPSGSPSLTASAHSAAGRRPRPMFWYAASPMRYATVGGAPPLAGTSPSVWRMRGCGPSASSGCRALRASARRRPRADDVPLVLGTR